MAPKKTKAKVEKPTSGRRNARTVKALAIRTDQGEHSIFNPRIKSSDSTVDEEMQDEVNPGPTTPDPKGTDRSLSKNAGLHGTIIVKDGHRVIVDFGPDDELEVMTEEVANKAGYPKNILRGVKINDHNHIETLTELSKSDPQFEQNIEYCRRTKVYMKNRVTYLIKHPGEEVELQCSATELKRLLRIKNLDEFYKSKRQSAPQSEGVEIVETSDDEARESDNVNVYSRSNFQNNTAIASSSKTFSSVPAVVADKGKAVQPASRRQATSLTILAKHIPFQKKNTTPGEKLAEEPKQKKVSPTTWCIVQDHTGAHSFKRYGEISKAVSMDFGLGHHPPSDRLFMQYITSRGGLGTICHAVADVIIRETNIGQFITVFLDIQKSPDPQEPEKKSYWNILESGREDAGYHYQGLVRCSSTMFHQAGGRIAALEPFLEKTEEGQRYLAKKRLGRSRSRSPTPQTSVDEAIFNSQMQNWESRLSNLMKSVEVLSLDVRKIMNVVSC